MPSVLMGLLETSSTFADSRGNGNLEDIIMVVSGVFPYLKGQAGLTGSYVCSASTVVRSSGIQRSTVYG